MGFFPAGTLAISLPWLLSFLLACNLATALPWSQAQSLGYDNLEIKHMKCILYELFVD
jgi:hypothetical protein